MSRRLNEIKTSLYSQIQNAITAAITDTVLPSIQNVLEMHGRPNVTVVDRASNGPHPGPRTGNSTVEDQRSSGRQRNPEVGNSQKSWENRPKTCFTRENSRLRSRESSVDSYTDEQNRDTKHLKSFGENGCYSGVQYCKNIEILGPNKSLCFSVRQYKSKNNFVFFRVRPFRELEVRNSTCVGILGVGQW